MDKASFLKFSEQFGYYVHIAGLGDEWVPPVVMAAAFDAWEASRSVGPVTVYKAIRSFLHRIPGEDKFGDDYLDWLQGVLDGDSYWAAEEILTDDEIQRIEARIAEHRRRNAEREALRRRRSKSQYAISDIALRRSVFERDGYRCRHCFSPEFLTVDHIVPLCDGGGDDLGNLQTLCRACNSSKGRRDMAAWQRRRTVGDAS